MSIPVEVAKASWNKIRTLANPDFFLEQSLLMASFSLVLLRVVQANISAIKARGTEEGAYRQREAVRTDLREFGGFGMGFLILRQLQWAIKSGLGKAFGIEAPAKQYAFRESLKNIWHEGKATNFIPDLASSTEVRFKEEALKPWISKLLNKPVLKQILTHCFENNPKAMITKAYKLLPIALGSIPAVGLAGYALERLTRSEKVLDTLSQFLGSSSAKNTVPPVQSKVVQQAGLSKPADGMAYLPPVNPNFGSQWRQPVYSPVVQSPFASTFR